MANDGQYLKVFVDGLERYQKLSDAEFGRLIRAAMAYKATGALVDLSGREGLLLDGIKLDIDRDRAKYAAICESRATAGAKGARARWQADGKNGKCHLPDGKNGQDKDKDKDKDKDNSNRPFAADSDLEALAAGLNAVLEEAQAVGLPMSQRDMDKGNELVAEYGSEWVLEALKRTVNAPATARSWRYVTGILRNAKQEGGFDGREKALGMIPDASLEELRGVIPK